MLKHLKTKNLVFKLSLYIIGLVSIILSSLLVINYQTTERIIMRNIEASIVSVLQKSVQEIQARTNILEDITQKYSFILMQRQFLKDSITTNFLASITKEDTLIIGASILYQPEARMDSINRLFHYSNVKDSSFVIDYNCVFNEKLLLKSNEKWSDPYYHDLYKMYVTSYSLPFYYGINGEISVDGVLKIDIPIKWLDDIVSDMRIYKSGRTMLVTRKGQFITHSNKDFIIKKNLIELAEDYNSPKLHSVLDSIKLMKSGYIVISDIVEDKERTIFTYQPLYNNGWSMIYQFGEYEYLEELDAVTRRTILYGIIGLLLVFIVCVYIINKVTKPIRQLTHLTKEIRKGNFDTILPSSKEQDEAGKLTSSIIAMQVEIKKYIENLTRTIGEKERIESDIRIASEIQSNMIPSTFPDSKEINGIDIYGKIIAAKLISGDLFDYRRIDDDHLYFLIGDVTDKGVPASLFMAMTRALVIAESKRESKPEKIFDAVNNQLCENNKNSIFVTAILGVIELKTGIINYCNAGHNYPYLTTKEGEVKMLKETHGLPLGIFPNQIYRTGKFVLTEGSSLFTYSDGVTESENKENKLYSEERLENLIQKSVNQTNISSNDLANSIIKDVDSYTEGMPPSDDITVLVVSKNKVSKAKY